MTFTSALERAVVLAREWKTVDAQVGAMAVGSDHDPRWSAADDAALDQLELRRAELVRSITGELAAIAQDHAKVFAAFLALGVERLSALTRSTEKSYTRGVYERDQWQRFHALPVGDRAEVFARGIASLEEYRAEIDRWLAR